MSESLHTKYRPRKFADLFQPHIVKVLQNSIIYDRIPSSLIFSGSTGTGKTSAARIYSMALNCQNRQGVEPCGNCDSCFSIMAAQGQSDVMEINASEKTGIGDVRSMIENTYNLPAMFGKYRIFLLDEAHKMSASAQNALLKPIEEPPSHVKFIICTTEIDEIIDTIVSRSHIHTFKRVHSGDILKNLIYICENEGWQYDEEALKIISVSSDGSPRKAVKMLDQLCSNNISKEDVEIILQISPKGLAYDIITNIVDNKTAELIRIVDTLNSEGRNLVNVSRDVTNLFLDIIKVKTNVSLDMSPDNIERIKNLAKKISASDTFVALKIMKEVSNALSYRNIADEIVLTTGFIELSSKFKKA